MASFTTNALFFTGKQGQPLAMAEPQAGIGLNGVFMNADAGFNAEALQSFCSDKQIEASIADNPRNQTIASEQYQHFDDQLYKEGYVIERTNAWLDSFRGLLVRFEKKIKSRMAQHWRAFV